MNQGQPAPLPPDFEKTQAKFSNLKWLLVVLVCIILGGVAFSYYQFVYKEKKTANPNPTATDETSDWSTFQNSIYGYSIKYPKIWDVDEKDTADVKFSKKAGIDSTLGTSPEIMVEIKATADDGQTKLEDWVKAELKDTKYTPTSTLIGGKEGILATITSDDTQEVYLVADSTKYHLDQIESSKETVDYFSQMVKTFKLVAKEKSPISQETNPTDILSQTNTNESFGYSIKYPKDWQTIDLNEGNDHILDQVGFANQAEPDNILFAFKVSDRTVDDETTLYKAGFDPSEIEVEKEANLGEYQGKKIVTTKGNVEVAALFLRRNEWTYVISGQAKNPSLDFQLYFDQMISSINFLKV